ncbi:MAG: 3-isopropylmalate dehydrogenase [Firmicutes bacterium]|nr:3-isopropylmalate dehydrogenase [Bacillota bacterium]
MATAAFEGAGPAGTAEKDGVKHIAVVAGDGIGPEVTAQAVRVLQACAAASGKKLVFHEYLIGGAAYQAAGSPLPEETLAGCRAADAVLLGAVGGPQWDGLPADKRPEAALLGLRQALGDFANLRPVRVWPALWGRSPLRPEVCQGVDLMIVRELTGGLYFGRPRGRRRVPVAAAAGGGGPEPIQAEEWQAIDTLAYAEHEIRRVAEVAFSLARRRRGLVTSVDKANVLESSRLWRQVVGEVAQNYPDVRLSHMLVDNAAMQLVRAPAQFDVILTENMFGDILSDEAAMAGGALGLLPSASLGGPVAIYEPVHGSAPDIAGKGIANPLGAILAAAMLVRWSFGWEAEAQAVETAVERALQSGRTADLAAAGEPALSTEEMGQRVLEELRGALQTAAARAE